MATSPWSVVTSVPAGKHESPGGNTNPITKYDTPLFPPRLFPELGTVIPIPFTESPDAPNPNDVNPELVNESAANDILRELVWRAGGFEMLERLVQEANAPPPKAKDVSICLRGNTTELIAVDLNARPPIEVTVTGMDPKSVSDVHPLNRSSGILVSVRLAGIAAETNPTQSWKAPVPIFVKLLASVALAKIEHPLNALSPIVTKLDHNDDGNEIILLHPSNAVSFIFVILIPEGTLIVVNAEQLANMLDGIVLPNCVL